MSEYTQGICGDGAAILKDGQPMTVEEVLDRLRERDALAAHVSRLKEVRNDFLARRVTGRGARDAFLKVAREAPAISLARFKAQQQAEVLYEFTHGSHIMPADLNLAMSTRAKELRRQAEGGA